MPIINITVKGKVASSDTKAIVNGNSDYAVNWVLDGEWADYDTKTMRVRYYDGTVIDCIFTGCSCSLPIITETCMIEIGLFAGDLITSTPAVINCIRCIRDDEGPVQDPTPSIYDQLLAKLNELGSAIAMRVDGGYVQYSTDNGKTWVNLIAEADLKGDKGDKGADGVNGVDGKDGAPGIYYGTTQPTGDTHPVWIDPDGGPDDSGLLPAVTAADNGKVLRVVSGAWSPVEIPSGGGVDMGITGATVGQIAKITAVDDTGKPTAWEAVDMPSGGGGDDGAKEFRFIQSITLGEQSDRVDISVDSSGNAFALHEVYVMLSAQSYEDAYNNVTFLPNGRWGSGDAYIVSANKASKSSETWKNNMTFHSVYADGVICSEQLPAKGHSNNLSSIFAINQAIITKISIVCKFAAGCTFLVIGR